MFGDGTKYLHIEGNGKNLYSQVTLENLTCVRKCNTRTWFATNRTAFHQEGAAQQGIISNSSDKRKTLHANQRTNIRISSLWHLNLPTQTVLEFNQRISFRADSNRASYSFLRKGKSQRLSF